MRGRVPYIEGTVIRLRALDRDDLTADYLDWLNDIEVNRHLFAGRRPSSQESLHEFFDLVRKDASCMFFAIDERSSGRFIGTLKFAMDDDVSRVASLGLLLGDKSCWGKGYGTEACRLGVDWAFDRWNVHKVTLGVSANNLGAIQAYRKVGFLQEGLQRGQLFENGGYVDVVLMGLLRDERPAP